MLLVAVCRRRAAVRLSVPREAYCKVPVVETSGLSSTFRFSHLSHRVIRSLKSSILEWAQRVAGHSISAYHRASARGIAFWKVRRLSFRRPITRSGRGAARPAK